MARKTSVERFMESYTPVTESGCWVWIKYTNIQTGYAQFYWIGVISEAY